MITIANSAITVSPLPPLKSLDAPQRVIYAGAFSKSLFPALRAAWLVVPEPLVAPFREQAALMCCSVPTLWQQTLADFYSRRPLLAASEENARQLCPAPTVA
ncbi:transcriptional regulator [Klebsiella michiganensis]|nr:transcriptional regulator [Klebsiella michiganensis]